MRNLSFFIAATAMLLLVGCERNPREIAREVCPFVVATQSSESLARMELLTGKGGISSQQAAEANKAYEDIALSSVKDYSSQSVCSVAVGAALGDEADRKRILRARAVVEEHKEVVARSAREGDALIREAEDLVETIERGFY